jgi:hypothetical protein
MVTAAAALIARVLWPPVFGRAVMAAGEGITVEPSTLGLRGTMDGWIDAIGAIGWGGVVGFDTFVAPGDGAVVVLVVVVVLAVVAGAVGVVATTPPQSPGRLTAMVRETEPPPGTASVMVTVNDASDIARPVAVPSMLPSAKEAITCPTVMFDKVRPFETVSPVTVAGPG